MASTSSSRPWPFALVGFVLSCYALHVEHHVAHMEPDEEYSSLCDIEQINASCRQVFIYVVIKSSWRYFCRPLPEFVL